eukprot:350033-Chlamydomonas_euryale.AAC.10
MASELSRLIEEQLQQAGVDPDRINHPHTGGRAAAGAVPKGQASSHVVGRGQAAPPGARASDAGGTGAGRDCEAAPLLHPGGGGNGGGSGGVRSNAAHATLMGALRVEARLQEQVWMHAWVRMVAHAVAWVHGHAWRHMGPYGYVWARIGMHGHICAHIGTHGHVWAYRSTHAHAGARMDTHGPAWVRMGMHGHI